MGRSCVGCSGVASYDRCILYGTDGRIDDANYADIFPVENNDHGSVDPGVVEYGDMGEFCSFMKVIIKKAPLISAELLDFNSWCLEY